MNNSNWIKAALAAACVVMASTVVAAAQEEEDTDWLPEFAVGVDVSSQQMTYGLVDNDDPIFTLSGSVAWQMLSFAVDGIFDTTDWGETDGGYGDRAWKYQELDLAAPPLRDRRRRQRRQPRHPDHRPLAGSAGNPPLPVLQHGMGH